MATHTGIKPYSSCIAPNQTEWKCCLCGLQFASKKGRDRHLKNKVCVRQKQKKALGSGISASSVCESNTTWNLMKAFTTRCELCDILLEDENSFLEHQGRHRGPGTVKCEICGERCIPGRHLQHHTMLHTSATPYKCEVCSQRFPLPSELERHFETHSTAKVVHSEDTMGKALQELTEYTNQQVSRSAVPVDKKEGDDLKKHLKTLLTKTLVHAEDTNGKLLDVSEHQQACQPAVLTDNDVKENFDTNDKVMLYVSEQQQVSQSGVMAENGEADNLECTKCDIKFNIRITWERHMRRHNIRDGPHICHVCSKQLSSRQKLLKHLQVIHKTQMAVKCELCGVKVSHTNLQTHMLQHASSKPYKCEVCGRHFAQASCLDRHMVTHTGFKRHKCNICNKNFMRLSGLEHHTLAIHTQPGQWKHQCHICQKKCPTEGGLKNHMHYHTNKDTHKCEVCGKGFSIRANLALHSVVHTGVRAYKCDVCGKAFQHKHHLATHMKSHSTDRPFTCDMCGCSFVLKHHLVAHIHTHDKLLKNC